MLNNFINFFVKIIANPCLEKQKGQQFQQHQQKMINQCCIVLMTKKSQCG
jgi:hypothetical protein